MKPAVLWLGLVGLLGCGPEGGAPPGPQDPKAPSVLALSTYSASLGTPIDVYVRGLPGPTEGAVSLRFQGTYRRSDGKVEPVDVIVPTSRIDGATLRWTSFGPFGNPFDAAIGDVQTGVFQGKASARVIRPDGTIVEDSTLALHLVFEVLSSVVLEDFQPASAACGAPARRAFAGFKYKVRAHAVGFTPTSFVYTLQTPSVVAVTDSNDPTRLVAQFSTNADGSVAWASTQVVHGASGATDTVDGKEAFLLPPMPPGTLGYNLLLTVEATDASGQAATTALVMYTENPITFFYDGRYTLAELYPPVPVSSCMPGGPQGRTVSYTDQHTETQQRSLTLTMSQSFLSSVSHATTGTTQNTWSTSDGKTYTNSVTDTSGWANATATSDSNTQSSSNTSGSSSTDTTGSMAANAFTFTGNMSRTDGTVGTIAWNNDTSGSTEHDFKAESEVEGSFFGLVDGKDTFGPTNKSTNGSDNSSGGSNATSMSTTGGWSRASTGMNGTNSSNSNTTSNSSTTGASETSGVTNSKQVSGSTASTDSTSASHMDTVGGSSSTATMNGSSVSEGTMNSQANAWTVSSAETIGQGFTGLVVAGTYGAFYRQMARYTREAFLLEYDKCGDAEVIGQVLLQDFMWAPDLAQAAVCPPLPKTNFPPPQCYMPPCND